MDQSNVTAPNMSAITLARKSWTAYIPITLLALLLFFVVVPLIWKSFSIWIGLAAIISSGLVVAYKFLVIKSVHLYCNDDGIWIYSGILPWDKGVQGVKWRDLDEAVYFQNMWSWMFKSYAMRIGHRFTKSSEIMLSHMAHGDNAVTEINTRHQELVRQNLLS